MTRPGPIPMVMWNRLLGALERQQINSVVGGEFRSSTTGRTLIVKPGKGGSGTTAFPPLTVRSAATEGFVTVKYGTVRPDGGGSLVPDMAGGTLADTVAPELEITGNGYVYLHVDTDADGLATAAEILFGASVPADDDTNAYLELAQITGWVDTPPITFTILQNVSGSQAHQRCDIDAEKTHLFGRV